MAEPRSLTMRQKFGLGVFVLIAGATFVFGIVNLRKSIILPLFRPENYYTVKTADQLEEERLQELRKLDTDSDGVSDYEELYIYRTSPYLEDSDSDGILDGVEIAQQTDPNCKRGSTCTQTNQLTTVSGDETQQDIPLPVGTPTTGVVTAGGTESVSPSEADINAVITETFGDPSSLTPDSIAQKLESMPSAELRDFLGKLGIPADLLAGTDDATIRALLQQTLAEMAAGSATAQ